jgi:serine O-acetyltransferase
MFEEIRAFIRATKERDPAARSSLEILLCYPGLHVLIWHRIAHWLWEHKLRLLARLISQIARGFTLIEIHPGARIGPGLFIDHGAGLVIGETAEIGENCTLFHGVTLGGTGKETGKRHPTLGNNVTIAAHAQILGSFTIGDNSVIGAGAVVLDPVPPNCTVVGVKARIVRREGKRVYDFRHDNLPDPDEVTMKCLLDVVRSLAAKVKKLDADKHNLEALLGEMGSAKENVEQNIAALQQQLAAASETVEAVRGHARRLETALELERKSIDRLAAMEGRLRELQEHVRDLESQIAESRVARV